MLPQNITALLFFYLHSRTDQNQTFEVKLTDYNRFASNASQFSIWNCHAACGQSVQTASTNSCQRSSPDYNPKNLSKCIHLVDECISLQTCQGSLETPIEHLANKSKFLDKPRNEKFPENYMNIALDCHNNFKANIDELLKRSFPNGLKTEWYFQGNRIGSEKKSLIGLERYKLNSSNTSKITIAGRASTESHTGLYFCRIRLSTEDSPLLVTYEVISLIVQAKKPLKLGPGQTTHLKCNGAYLLRSLLKNVTLFQVWRHNGHVIKNETLDRGSLVAERSIDTFVLRVVTINHAGTYVCSIEEPFNGRRWITAEVKIKVIEWNSILALIKSPSTWLLIVPFNCYLTGKCIRLVILKLRIKNSEKKLVIKLDKISL